jgi:molybdenum cofactor biosynthesis protein B
LTVSDTRTLSDDKSGALLVDFVTDAGHRLVGRQIIVDDQETITLAVKGAIAAQADVVLLTGGTGLTRRDVTPEAIGPLIDKEIPGFGELFRFLSYEEIGAATIQSRAFGALCGGCLVFGLPGSTGAVRLAVDKILRPQLDVRTRPCNFAELLPRIK